MLAIPPSHRVQAGEPLPWSPSQLLVLVILVAVGVSLGWAVRLPGISIGPDDSTMLSLSQSLASGHYRNEFLLGTPSHVQYPPGMPLWLLLWTSLGGGFAFLFGLNFILLSASGILVGDALRRLGFAWLGIAAAGSVVLNPVLGGLAGSLYSESLFTALSVASLWCLLRADQSRDDSVGTWITLAVGCALLSFLVRSIGIATIAAVFATLVVRRRWRWAAVTAGVASLLMGVWFGYVMVASRNVGRSYVADLQKMPLDIVSGGLLGRVGRNLSYFVVRGMPDLFGLPMIPGTILDNAAWAILLVGSAALGLVWFARRWPAAAAGFGFTAAILLLWPWGVIRLAAPLAPIVISAILIGAVQFGSRLPGARSGSLCGVAVAAVLLCSAGQQDLLRWRADRGCPVESRAGGRPGCMPIEDRSFRAVAALARERLPASAVIAASKESTANYLTGRLVVPLSSFDRDLDDVVGEMAELGVTHLLLARLYAWEGERLGPQLVKGCHQLTVVAAVDGPAVLLAPRTPGSPDACVAVKRVLAWDIPD